MRAFCVLKTDGKKVRELTAELPDNASLAEALEACCPPLDLPRPVVLRKHLSDYEKFGRAVFRRDDFVEEIYCDRFELEQLREPRASSDVRNAQGNFVV